MTRDLWNLRNKRRSMYTLLYRRGLIAFGSALALVIAIVLGLLLLFTPTAAHGQQVDVSNFPGTSVGTKLTNAAALTSAGGGCISGLTCILIIPPQMSVYATGTLPTMGANQMTISYMDPAAVKVIATGASTFSTLGGTFTGGAVTSPITLPDGTCLLPGLAWTATPSWGMMRDNTYGLFVAAAGSCIGGYLAAGHILKDTGCYGWSVGLVPSTLETQLCRDAANVVAQKFGAFAQEFRVYGTTTGPKYASLKHDGTNGIVDSQSGKMNVGPSSTGANVKGTTSNDSAAAGIVGEVISATLGSGSPVALTSTTTANITSISLTAGDWDVSGSCDYTFAGTTSYTRLDCGISTVSATLDAQGTFLRFNTAANVPTNTNNPMVLPAPVTRISLASTTTIYLVTTGGFSVSTISAYGDIRARRVR